MLEDFIDHTDYQKHIRRCGNETSTVSKRKHDGKTHVHYKRLKDDSTEVEMNIDENNQLKLKTMHSKFIERGAYGYKAIKAMDGTPCLAKLFIPKEVRVACDPTIKEANKMRAQAAIVVQIWMVHADTKGEHVKYFLNKHISEGYSCVYQDDGRFVYPVGNMVIAQNFDPNMEKTCAPGIHFVATQEEALAYHNIYHIESENIVGYQGAEEIQFEIKHLEKFLERYGSIEEAIQKENSKRSSETESTTSAHSATLRRRKNQMKK
jgi:hypothetical protein